MDLGSSSSMDLGSMRHAGRRHYQCLRPCRPVAAVMVVWLLQLLVGLSGQGQSIGLPNCTTSCGRVSVPYPFGIERGCYLHDGFRLTCNTSSGDSTPRLYASSYWNLRGGLYINNISLDDSTVRFETTLEGVKLPAAPAAPYLIQLQLLVEWGLASDVLHWRNNETRAGNATCPGRLGSTATACHSSHGTCHATTNQSYKCRCDGGFQGNAYLSDGCQDIDECLLPDTPCFGNCTNVPGTFLCQCPMGTIGNPQARNGCVQQHRIDTGLIVGLGFGSGAMLSFLVLLSTFIISTIEIRRKRKMKQRFFKQNRGQLLQQLVGQRADIGERMIVTLEELEKATNNFDRTREIGGGGHGTIYKGILSSLHVVAIKKSKIVIQREIDEFINEVAILSQINHKNIVKLLGCCLETEVPLLVYEFISNGTLHNHLHVEASISLSWKDRLRIAVEIAKALAYLHSLVSMPIIHRDVKSPNILLDDNLTVKLSDFGASRYVPVDQSGLDTTVQGTFGYLDPMYHSTGHLTEKSDVYSFGVILIELLTRKKPVSYRSPYGHGLVYHFVTLLSEGNLDQIVDRQVCREGGGEVVDIALLAAMCVKFTSNGRPTMRQVEMTLESIQAAKEFASSDTMTDESEEDCIRANDQSIEGRSVDAATCQD